MKRFKNILYYADYEGAQEHALTRAVKLAKSNEASLTIIDIIEESEIAPDVDQQFGFDLNIMRSQQRFEELEAMIEPYSDMDVAIIPKVVIGIPFIELVRSVLKHKYDLVIKTARLQQGFVDRIFGSCDMHLLRKCPCPVWVDGPKSVYPYKNIIAAVDPSDENCHDLNKLIMDLSTSLAKKESANLHIIHAWAMEGESLLRSPRAGLSKVELDILLSSAEHKHKEQLNNLLFDYDLTSESDNVNLIKGEAAEAILSTAREVNADLIVMGTVGRTGIPGFFIGNTAEDVLQGAHISVLAVKPEGFVSPVTPA
jgi:nucleotide-binding universal stress UspA family protein